MTKDKITEYLLENERLRYQYAKELQKTLRWAILAILGAITIIACSYMYFVVPVEEEYAVADNGSQVVVHSTVSGDNTNGL